MCVFVKQNCLTWLKRLKKVHSFPNIKDPPWEMPHMGLRREIQIDVWKILHEEAVGIHLELHLSWYNHSWVSMCYVVIMYVVSVEDYTDE